MPNSRHLLTVSTLAAFALTICAPVSASDPAPAPAAATAPAFATDDEKAAYALGFALWRNLATFELTPAEIELVVRALREASSGATPVVTLEEARPMIEALRKSRLEAKMVGEKERGKTFTEAAAKESGALRTDSGMIYLETAAGSGASPAADDTVRVHYRGTLIDGTEFDSSHKRNQPAEFALKRVIACWTEGLQKMKVGGKARLTCPPDLAYGDRGRPSIPPGATLSFELELLEIVSKEAPKPAEAPVEEHR